MSSAVIRALLVLDAIALALGGVWLVVAGQWRPIGLGVGMAIGLVLVWLVAYTYVVAIAAFGAALDGRGRAKLARGVMGLSSLLGHVVVSLWILLVFDSFQGMSGAGLKVPMLIWGYGVAQGGVALILRKPDQATGACVWMLQAAVGYAAATALLLLGHGLGAIAVALAALAVFCATATAALATAGPAGTGHAGAGSRAGGSPR
jgi:hypothetical protein